MNADTMQEIIDTVVTKVATISSTNEHLIGQAVAEAVTAAGGTASALFAVTQALAQTHHIPYGSRRLRKAARQYRRSGLIEEAAVAVFDLLAGDAAASTVDIGRWVDKVANVRGLSPVEAVQPLVKRLADVGVTVTPSELLKHRRAFQVARIGGAALAKLIPGQVTPVFLPCLAKLLDDDRPWVGHDRVIKAAKLMVRQQPTNNKQVNAIVAKVLAEEKAEADEPSTIRMTSFWHVPKKAKVVRKPKAIQPPEAA